MRQVASLEELAAKYANDDVEFFHFYVREPHAGERSFKRYAQPSSFDEKMGHARELQQERGIKNVTIALDGMEEQAHRKFGRLPNMVYVVDKKAVIVFKAMWTRSEQVDEVLRELVREERSVAAFAR